MVSPVTPLPDPPSRTTQDRAEFVVATDQWLSAQQVFVVELNIAIDELNDLGDLVTIQAQQAEDAANRAENSAAFRVSFATATLADLNAIAGQYVGQSAAVFDDADPANNGIYGWTGSAWDRLSDGIGSTVDWTDITNKPASFPPSAHTHAMSDITGLSTALSGKAATGAIGSSGLTMTTARLLGRTAGGSGAVQEISLGDGLSFDGTTLKYTGSTDMVYPAAGIAVSTGSGWGSSLAAPSGSLVGTTGAQTLTNKTLGSGTSITAGTDSGMNKTGGTLYAGVSVNDSGGVSTNSPGYRGTPRQTGTNRTLSSSDNGKLISLSGNATVPTGLPIGFACDIYNNSSSSSSIVQGSGVTLRLSGTASTGSRTLAQRGLCSLRIVNTNEAVVSGALS